MMMPHYPGRWIVDQEDDDGNLPVVSVIGMPQICFVVGEDPDEREANARLIAAAPELLDALKNLVPRFEKCCAFTGSDAEFVAEATQQARDAIAKSEGRR